MNYREAWDEIVGASNLEAVEGAFIGHDLLDGVKFDAHGCAMVDVFTTLCRKEGVKGWSDITPILDRIREVEGFEGLRIPDHRIEFLVDRLDEDNGGLVKGICTNTSVRRGVYSDEWGTPIEIIDYVRQLYGPIDLDLASNKKAQLTVAAADYYSAERPCPSALPDPCNKVLWCNPPGPGSRVKEFWAVWCDAIQRGARGAFLLFQQDHWRQIHPPPKPVVCVVLRKRLKFVPGPSQTKKAQGANFASTLVLTVGPPRDRLYDLGHPVTWIPKDYQP